MLKKLLSSITGQILAVLLGLAIVSACTLDSSAKNAPGLSLANTNWELQKLGKESVTSDRPLTLNFDDSRLTGYSGCNRYFGSYTGSGDGVFSTGPLGATKMACMGEKSLLEQRFIEQLKKASQYAIAHNQLHLLDAERNILMMFSATKPESGVTK
ncbi:MAG: META domain-containing protein [Gammaproteobacteria bacterium]|nr:META domain-containing protein [Gammaproteobacteria bacterium]MBU1723261.1 META domain-containing protein [Gammaproteobacteria bacterium]MBU2003858.1 META domain-containing protein [Gammaproteobacteria bacterium]